MSEHRIKQYIIIRKDLGMPKGKMAAQVAHASLAIFFNMMKQNIKKTDQEMEFTLKVENPFMQDWMMGHFTKIVLYVESEEALKELHQKALDAGLPTVLIQDAGFTHFKEPTYTAVAIGPDDPEKIQPITSHLKVY